MVKDSALLIERYDLLKSRRKWRLGFLLLLILLALLFSGSNSLNNKIPNVDHIARIDISGFIDVDRERIKNINRLANNEKVKAVIVHIDSGGGTVVGGETLYYALRNLADKKPVISYFGNQATSAAYMIAVASDYIVAPRGSVTGSVGVLAQAAEFTGLAEKVGIKPIIVKSSKLKSVPHPAEKVDQDVIDSVDHIVSDIFEFFLNVVVINREGLTGKQIAEIATGKVFTGRQALEVGLIDDVGDFSKVTNWLNTKLEDKNLKIIEHDLKQVKKTNLVDYINTVIFGEKAGSNAAILSYWNSSI